MDVNKKTTSIPITTAALIVIIALLAASTVYFAYQERSGTSASTNGIKASSVPYAGIALPLGLGALAQTGGASSTANSITVTGTGAVSYIPNEALVDVSVVTNKVTAEDATSSNAAATLSVIKALNGIGISNSSIETQSYSLSADYANCYSSCVPQITGYSVTNSLQVNITSDSPNQLGLEAGRVIDTSVAAGANQVSLSFSETNPALTTLVNGALQEAVASAHNQAQVMAGSLGVSITGVISASEVSSYTPQYYGAQVFGVAAPAASTPIMPGTQSTSVTVQVVYAIS